MPKFLAHSLLKITKAEPFLPVWARLTRKKQNFFEKWQKNYCKFHANVVKLVCIIALRLNRYTKVMKKEVN